jgi:hypothetical protein
MSDLELNPDIPEFDLEISEVVPERRKLKAKWSLEAADDLRRLLNRLQPGDYVMDKLKKRVVKIRKVATTYDMATQVDATYEVEDVLNGTSYIEDDANLGEPLNEMEVLAHVRATED